MAKPLVINIPHQLGREEAKRRLERGFGQIREQIGGKALAFEERWEGESLHFAAGAFGQRVSGRADVLERAFGLSLTFPGCSPRSGKSFSVG